MSPPADRLFEDIERTDASPRRHDESGHRFLNRIAGSYWDNVRALCEKWFSDVPPSVRADVRSRFISASELQSRSAFWEMYLHAAFRGLGYEVEPHPNVPSTDRRPDFKVKRGDSAFYVEATYCTPSGEDVADAARAEVVLAALDRLKNREFWLHVEIGAQGKDALPAKSLRARVEAMLQGLDPEPLNKALIEGASTYDDLPTLHWAEAGWIIEVRAIPKPPAARGDDEIRPVGVVGPTVAWADDRGSLLRTLEAKARHYGPLDAPYLIAVRLDGLGVDRSDICDALFGQRAAEITSTGSGQHAVREFRKPDGLWHGPKGPRATRVSGVLFAVDVSPPLVCRSATEPFLWLNPWAKRPLPPLPWRTTEVDLTSGKLTERASNVVLHEFFALFEGWPGDDAKRFGDR